MSAPPEGDRDMRETTLTDAGFARRVAAELDAHGYPNHHILMVEARRRVDLCDPTQDERVKALVEAAIAEADKAMTKFPQPNYVISKVAEEAGEVVKAAIHCAEGREKPEAVTSEIVQCMAMLFRLYLEGDQVHGLAALRALEQG